MNPALFVAMRKGSFADERIFYMSENIFDSHAHYDDDRFDADRDQLLSKIHEEGVSYIVNAGADLPSSEKSIKLAEKYPFIYATVGVHPHEAKSVTADLEKQLTDMAKNPKVVAIGEIGLDYHYDLSPRDVQKEVFRRQLELAYKLNLPVVIHNREASGDTLDVLRNVKVHSGTVHSYSGSAEMVPELAEMGFYFGFTGVITFKNARKTVEAAAAVPMDRLLVETDCPYLAPEPFRGKRCDSSMITQIAHKLAEIKGVTPQELLDITNKNARRLYSII